MFYPRNQSLVEIGPLQQQITPNSTLTYHIRPTLPKFKDSMYKGPLNKRAWILQERVLPRAILYFSRTQLYWECRSRHYAKDGDSQPVHPLLKYLLCYHLIQEDTGRATPSTRTSWQPWRAWRSSSKRFIPVCGGALERRCKEGNCVVCQYPGFMGKRG